MSASAEFPLPDRIARFLADPLGDSSVNSFETLALAAYRYQVERIEPLRKLAKARGIDPDRIVSWRDVPLVPSAAYKSLTLAAAPAVEVFRSSGTTGGAGSGGVGVDPEQRSVHHHPFPDLYKRTIDLTFPRYCLTGLGRPPMLSLVPPRELLPDSSLSFMVDHVLARFGAPESANVVGPRGVEAGPARSWAGARQRAGQPVVVLSTALALDQWLGALERQELRFRLAAGSVLFETGGFKGRDKEITRDQLVERIETRLGIPRQRIVREYGMTELTSQFYTEALADGDPDLFVAPPWVRVRILDPETLAEAPLGTIGLIAIFDLANLGSAVHLLTQDLGVAEAAGFRLLGRAAGAELRGCSLAAEELAQGGGVGLAGRSA